MKELKKQDIKKGSVKCKLSSYNFSNQISRNFQGFFKAKLQFLRTKIYSVNQHSLPPYDHLLPKTRHGVIYDFYFFDHRWSYYFILLSTTRLCKMTGYDLQLHLRYRNSIWNKETEIIYCSYTKMFLRYPWVLQVPTPRMSQIFLGKIM